MTFAIPQKPNMQPNEQKYGVEIRLILRLLNILRKKQKTPG